MIHPKVLFIGPKVANLYLDIIAELQRQGYEVDFYEYKSYKLDPYNLRGYRKYGRIFTPSFLFERKIKKEWASLLSTSPYNKKYDFLFVVDGDSLHPILFSILKERNPHIRTINYLFDSTRRNYEFNHNFHLFDRVATFDIYDSNKYNIELCPIYWVKEQEESSLEYVFFGLGAYILDRYNLFASLTNYAHQYNLNSSIKIFSKEIKDTFGRRIKKKIVDKFCRSGMIPREHYYSDLITHKAMAPTEYREMINKSEIIIDSNAPEQDGLTARFMWALGAEKKIITTNKFVKKYDFYSPEQIYIVDDDLNFENNPIFTNFVRSEFHMTEKQREIIKQYRIDFWIKNFFENKCG